MSFYVASSRQNSEFLFRSAIMQYAHLLCHFPHSIETGQWSTANHVCRKRLHEYAFEPTSFSTFSLLLGSSPCLDTGQPLLVCVLAADFREPFPFANYLPLFNTYLYVVPSQFTGLFLSSFLLTCFFILIIHVCIIKLLPSPILNWTNSFVKN